MGNAARATLREGATESFRAARTALFAGVAAVTVMASGSAAAQDSISGNMGVSYNSHFISYGADVWGGGHDLLGDRSTAFVWGDVNVAINSLTLTAAWWSDVNNNVPSAIGGYIQEVDVSIGGTYAFGPVSLGAAYQRWNYASDVEQIVDFTLGFNDMNMFIEGFAFNPKAVWHIRADGNGAQPTGSAVVLSVGPSFPLGNALSISVPAGIAFFLDEDFQFGNQSGYAYSYIGGSLAVPLSFIPQTYGAWTLTADLTAYFTDEDAIPFNPESNFLVTSIGTKVAF